MALRDRLLLAELGTFARGQIDTGQFAVDPSAFGSDVGPFGRGRRGSRGDIGAADIGPPSASRRRSRPASPRPGRRHALGGAAILTDRLALTSPCCPTV
ncbi:hypothetical protein NHF48_006585 [Sphingomonas sp. H160509]|uniref:hypothetical protein n=1 Tax=Sphingomonas sp. H160509 TaxID=2955313 RepID=UPI002098586B|nr:hypothetical protein [Sphingomonas sp. H160509]MDD1450708.1 hypothetical protein [Sphingomonas sp. H160509]